jgi:hypothetical protein
MVNNRLNKKGWIRILEATIAVLIVTSVLVLVYTRQTEKTIDASEYIYSIQKEILDELSSNLSLRAAVLANDSSVNRDFLNVFVSSKIPVAFGSRLLVCELSVPPIPCKLNSTDFLETRDYDLFVLETVISANLTDYSPKKVKLFVWENR